ncbi:MAG: PEP-CTERM sorting domain-containing protein [Sedimentisphaerales bacterium]|nr:PEP-CTERM sorting domain-containing protein [Sedimentisphaerales bacterium]
MVERKALTTGQLRTVLYLFVIIALFSGGHVYGQIDGTALMLQKTPAQGGSVTPEPGLHRFSQDSEITLTAIAKSGYQFVYWIGDVTTPTANQTTVYLDAPKIIIAVFERTEFEFVAAAELMSESSPIGGLSRSAGDYGNQGYSGGGAKRPHKFRFPTMPDEEEEPEEEFPVPEKEPDFPVPEVPEPATVLLLGLGTLFAITTNRQKQIK